MIIDGYLENPQKTFPVFTNTENWCGYFIPGKQNIFDAISNFSNDIYMIKHQNYFCVKNSYLHNNYGITLPVNNEWVCDKSSTNIAYGEMVILKTLRNIPDFKWNISQNKVLQTVNEDCKHFTYDEKIDYFPVIVFFDDGNPEEIAAITAKGCIGAAQVNDLNGFALIKAYVGNYGNDSIFFEEYFNDESENKIIKEYFVFNNRYHRFENTPLKPNINQELNIVSLNSKKLRNKPAITNTYYISESSEYMEITYKVAEYSTVNIEVFNNFGKKLGTLINNSETKGIKSFNWNLEINNVKLKKGIYLLKITINNKTINKKLIIQ